LKYLIAGLGNVGDEYLKTRHNIGFDVLDFIIQKNQVRFENTRYAFYAEIKHRGKQIHFIKPTTYMNLSGKAVKYYLNELKISKENLLVITDDLALPLGTLRLRPKGSDGGHNGLKSIDAELISNQYARLRFGIGNNFSKGRQVNYVLGKFTIEEEKIIQPKIEKAADMILSFASIGIELTMTKMNE
jgi:peptidyl-tRNA hydrolase, PTH1 family